MGEPALGPEVRQHPLGDQHGAQRDRHDQDRRDQPLVAALDAHPEGDRQRDADVDDRGRQRELQRRPDRRPQVVGREELVVVREPAAFRRRERQPQPVEERIDEQREHEQRRRRGEQQRAVERRAGERGSGGGGTGVHGRSRFVRPVTPASAGRRAPARAARGRPACRRVPPVAPYAGRAALPSR